MNDLNADAKAIFFEALSYKGSNELKRFLDEACGADEPVRARVEELLRAHQDAGNFLGGPQEVTQDGPITERPGTIIGPYKLLEQIGEGGFGVVFMAEQHQPIRRKVALKVLKPGMDTRQVIARFEAERQALALMDHPNIAKVLDGGETVSGRPYFVMDLVRGVPITQFCDQNQMPVPERLELFVSICQAVQHAHQKGIIHRDLKPTNVIVTLHDNKPVVKVIDFGIAKAMGQQLTDKTLSTGFDQLIGTPLYMSPEQAQLSGLDVDTRSDIYSLGVLLYELLTGTTPFDQERLRTAGYDELRRIIREEEPPKPSTRISMPTASGDLEGRFSKPSQNEGLTGVIETTSLANIAEKRKSDPKHLRQLIRGELDWIVMKALEKDRNRRYESASAFAADVQRYLADEPVHACPPSVGYRLRKFLRRHRGPVLAALIVFLALVGGIIGTSIGLLRAERAWEAEADRAKGERLAKLEAEDEKRIALAVRDFLQNKLLGQADIRKQAFALLRAGGTSSDAKRNPTVRELLDRAAAELTPERIEANFPDQPLVQAEILYTVGETYQGLGENDRGIHHLERSRTLREARLGPDHPHTLGTLSRLAWAYREAGRLTDAIRLFEQVHKQQEEKLGPDHENTLITLHNLARTYQDAGRPQDAIRLYEQVRRRFEQQLGQDHPNTLATLINLALAYQDAGDRKQAIRLLEELRPRCLLNLGPEYPDTLAMLNNLAMAYQDDGRLLEAISLFSSVYSVKKLKLGADHPESLITLGNLAWAYRCGDFAVKGGRLNQAIAWLEEVLQKEEKKLGPDHPETLSTINKLASTLWAAGKLDRSIPLLESLLPRLRRKLGDDHPHTFQVAFNLGVNYRDAGRLDDAIRIYEEWLPRAQAKLQPGQQPLPLGRLSAAETYSRAGRFDRALGLWRETLAYYGGTFAADDPRLANMLGSLGETLLKVHQPAEAEKTLRDCLAIREKKEPDGWTTFNAKSMLGEALLGQKRYADAEPLLVQGYEGMKQRLEKIPKEAMTSLTEALERLVQLYDAWGKPEQADQWRKKLGEDKIKTTAYMPPKKDEKDKSPTLRHEAADAPKKPGDDEVQKLIDQLGSNGFNEREAASRRLDALGEAALPALRKAAASSQDPEIRQRASQLAESIARRCFGEIRRFEGSGNGVSSVAFSPDGRLAASGGGDPDGNDPAIRLWDVRTGQELRRLQGHTAKVWGVAFSPADGTRILSCSEDKTLRLWNAESGEELKRLQGHDRGVLAAVFCPGGKRALSCSWDKTVRLWDLASGRELNRLEGHTDTVRAVAVSSDGRWALSGGFDTTIRLWNLENGHTLKILQGHTGMVHGVAFMPDGRRAVSCAFDKTIRLWNLDSGKQSKAMPAHAEGIHGLALSHDGRRLLTASWDQTVRLWDSTTGEELCCFVEHHDRVHSVAFSPDDRYALSGSSDKTLRLWRLPKPNQAPKIIPKE